MRPLLSILLILAPVGCATPAPPPASPPPTEEHATVTETSYANHGHGHGKMGHDDGPPSERAMACPMAVEGTTAHAEDVEGGAAVVFTTTGDVRELRQRVTRMAEMHNQDHGRGQGHMMHRHGDQESGKGMKGDGMMMPDSTARSEDVAGGTRLVFTPQAPADLPELRAHVGRHTEIMAAGRCPMMSAPDRNAEADDGR